MTGGPVVLDARTAAPHFPGIGRSVVGLARGLADAGGPPPLLLHARVPDARLPLDALSGIACSSTPFDLAQQWEIRDRLRAVGAAVYHSPYYLMPFAPGVPTVVTCHDLIPLTVPGTFDAARRLAYRLAHVLAFRAASAIIVPSHATGRDVRSCFPAHSQKVVVIPEAATMLDAGHAAVGAPLPVPDDAFIVLSVGSDKPHKSLPVLLEAWRRVAARRGGASKGLCLVLAGPRERRDPHLVAAGSVRPRDGGVVSLGRVSDAVLAQLYRRAGLFVFPSRAEGFGLPVLEAMAHGAPVICSRIGALSELCGDAAAFVTPGDPAALAEAIERLLEAPGELDRLRAAGLRRAAAFSWDATARTTSETYARAAREHP